MQHRAVINTQIPLVIQAPKKRPEVGLCVFGAWIPLFD